MAAPVYVPSADDDLIERVVGGDEDAWRDLLASVFPTVLEICKRRRLGGELGSQEDVHRDVAMQTISKLQADQFAALRRYCAAQERYPDTTFVRWLAVIVSHTFIDYLRAQPDYQRRRQATARTLVRVATTAIDDERHADPRGRDIRTVVELRRIIGCLLDAEFPAEQRRAVLLWLDGNSAAEISEEMDLGGPKQANRLLHAARERLRRRFRESE